MERSEQEAPPEIRGRRSAATRRTIEITHQNPWHLVFKPFERAEARARAGLGQLTRAGSNARGPRGENEKAGSAAPLGMAYPTDGTADRQWPLLGPASEIILLPTGCENGGWQHEVPEDQLDRGPERRWQRTREYGKTQRKVTKRWTA
eukprot:7937405-Pyramimonas_sp.AAC.1